MAKSKKTYEAALFQHKRIWLQRLNDCYLARLYRK